MKDLIEALQIFLKYGDPYCPTHCEHDVLTVVIEQEKVSPEDAARLKELGFMEDTDIGCFKSYRFGSA
jgi:hypothetical protein